MFVILGSDLDCLVKAHCAHALSICVHNLDSMMAHKVTASDRITSKVSRASDRTRPRDFDIGQFDPLVVERYLVVVDVKIEEWHRVGLAAVALPTNLTG